MLRSADTSSKIAAVKEVKNEATEESTIGRTVTCPVTGEEFIVTKDTPTYTYQGKRYYFCCEACIPKFKAEPQKYTQGMPEHPSD